VLATCTIHQTAKGLRWEVRIRKSGYRTLTLTFADKSAARKWATEIEASIEQRLAPDTTAEYRSLETIGDLLCRYLAKISPTKKRYRLGRLIRHPLSNIELRKLGSYQLAQYRDEKLKSVGNGTVLKELGLLLPSISSLRYGKQHNLNRERDV